MDIKIKYKGAYKLVVSPVLSTSYNFSNGIPLLLQAMSDLPFFEAQPNSYKILNASKIDMKKVRSGFSRKALNIHEVKPVNTKQPLQASVVLPLKTGNVKKEEKIATKPIVPVKVATPIITPETKIKPRPPITPVVQPSLVQVQQPVIKQRAKELTKNIKKKASTK